MVCVDSIVCIDTVDLPSSSPELEARRQQFKQRGILEVLDRHVMSRSELILAWDFTTSSLEATTEHLRFMRDDGLTRVSAAPSYTVDRVTDDYSPTIYRRVDGTFQAPLYLNTEKPVVKARLVRNWTAPTFVERLRPQFQKLVDVPFSMWIPRRAVQPVALKNGSMDASGIGKASILQYGHGLFQSLHEGDGIFLHQLANDNNHVIVATDWWGLQQADTSTHNCSDHRFNLQRQ
jgi:hypothetical protein